MCIQVVLKLNTHSANARTTANVIYPVSCPNYLKSEKPISLRLLTESPECLQSLSEQKVPEYLRSLSEQKVH